MEEIRTTNTGLGLLSSDPASLAPSQMARGRLPVNYGTARTRLDTEEGCRTDVTEEQQQYQTILQCPSLSLVKTFRVFLRQQSYAIKNQRNASKKDPLGLFALDARAGSYDIVLLA